MEEITPKRSNKKEIIIFILLVLSVSANFFFLVKLNSNVVSNEENFNLIVPSGKEIIIDSDMETDWIIHYEGLKRLLEEEIGKYNGTGKVGFFIQDIKTGAWLGINEKEEFAPASLLKIPIMMSALKKVERGEITLKDEVMITKNDFDPLYGSLHREGEIKISILQLLKKMIISSDNTAKNAIVRQLSDTDIDSVFVHIGIKDPFLTNQENVISPRDYIRIFKSLYYSTYLSRDLSEFALDLTTDTSEESLISKGVPSEIQVAHKFGVAGEEELHDCGIVYHHKNPYFICVMTKSLGFEKSKELIVNLSKKVYDFVNV
ncbi:MAG: class A beta-lactamase-related serine hydrolase [Candidatus Pacearchaeota archaeon]|nr:class A beta-lactamase-related serine hydrolase [Candidatus Pacearchaeota archaeon]